MKKTTAFLFAGSMLLLGACNDSSSSTTTTTEKQVDSTPVTAARQAEISLADAPASPEFPGAQLGIASVKAEKNAAGDSAKVSFAFNVKNYELKSQTSDVDSKVCANSDKGQHIHFILDNMPYVALYEPKHETTLPFNTEHTLICFLSRSYHESVKSKDAAVVYHFKIDEKGALQKLETPATPMLFYSRPKGDYVGKKEIENVLLDFYLWNAALGNDYKVKADIKNNTTGAASSFTLNEWKPKFIQGLGEGKCNVTLTLLDKNGQPVAGPNTTAARDFNLAAQEPMK